MSVQGISYTPKETKVDQEASRGEKDNPEDKEKVRHVHFVIRQG